MLLYIVICLAASLAAGVKVPMPTFSPVYSMRMELHDNGMLSSQNIWVDTVQNRTRTDFLDVDGQAVYEMHNEEYKGPVIHWIFPVTTEERGSVRRCFLAYSWYSQRFMYALYTLPSSMEGYHFVGKERMHDEEASKWKLTVWDRDSYHVFTIWVTERQGVSVPLRSSIVNVWLKNRYFHYVDYFDYDASDIDPEIWNIHKGMDCKYSVSSDVKNDSDFENMIDLMNVPEGLNHFDNFAGFLRHFNPNNVMRQMFQRTNQFTDRSKEMGFMRDHVQTSTSSQSKALPFPYTAEEVERLSKDLPKTFDWRVFGATAPKPETSFTDMYALTAAGAVEGALFVHRGGREPAAPLSAQAIIDCSWGFGNRGNDGGSAEASFEWMMKHGLPTNVAYPFKDEVHEYIQCARKSDADILRVDYWQDYCHIDEVEIETKVKGYHKVPSNDVNALKLAIVNHGPVVVMFDLWEMYYSYGIYNETGECRNNPGSGNMQGLVVGYGSADEEYWILQIGSWIIPIVIRDNMCGVMNAPLYVTVE